MPLINTCIVYNGVVHKPYTARQAFFFWPFFKGNVVHLSLESCKRFTVSPNTGCSIDIEKLAYIVIQQCRTSH